MGKLKRWRESTSTSPSGLHLGHHKSLVIPFPPPPNPPAQRNDTPISPIPLFPLAATTVSTSNTGFQSNSHSPTPTPTSPTPTPTPIETLNNAPPEPTIDDLRRELLQYQLDMVNYCISHSYSLKRWRKVVNVMIQKEPGNNKIHRLRVLHLYEADWSALLAIKWRELMHHAVDNLLLHPEQYGGVPGKDSITPAFIETQQHEHSRCSRFDSIKMSFDATACYDRIIPSFAMILCRATGQHHLLTSLLAHQLSSAEYLLKTSLGVSESGYKHSATTPIYGTGQGSPTSPILWTIISSRLFDAHGKLAKGATYWTPDRQELASYSMVGFVDDTYGVVTANEEDQATFTNLLHDARQDAQLWTDLLAAAGGALEPPKCKYHAITFKFSAGGAPVMQHYETDQDQVLSVTNPITHQEQSFERLSPNESHRILGCYTCPGGSQKTAYEELSKKALARSKLILHSTLDVTCTWRYYHSIFLPSISYSMPVNMLSPTKLTHLTHKSTQPFLNKVGYSRTTPSDVVYGPKKYGGIGFQDFRVIQGIEQLYTFTKHYRSTHSTAGLMAKIALAWTQHNSGSLYPILQYPSINLPYLESKWFASLRLFLAEADISLTLTKTYVYPIQRQHDLHLMDYFRESGKFKPSQLRILNYCRLYLNVTVLSDICDATGTCISRNKFSGTSDTESSLTDSYPRETPARQDNPNRASWAVWRKALLTLTSSPTTLALEKPLGKWLHRHHQLKRQWGAYFCPIERILYIYDFNTKTYQQHLPPVVGTNLFHTAPSLTTLSSPGPAAVPAHVLVHPTTGQFKLRRPIPLLYSPPPMQDRQPWATGIPLYHWELLKHTSPVLSSHQQVAEELSTACNTAQGDPSKCPIIVCDGSVLHSKGAFGWVLSLASGFRLAEGNGPAYGHQMSSFRAEGYGMLSALLYVHYIIQAYAPECPLAVQLFCDNEGLVGVVNRRLRCPHPEFVNTTMSADWDLIQEICSIISKLSEVTIQYVKGHQDQDKSVKHLSLEARLNIEADSLATDYQERFPAELHPTTTSATPSHESNPVQINISTLEDHGTFTNTNTLITKNIRHTIKAHCGTKRIIAHIKRKEEWDEPTFQLVDWAAYTSAVTSNTLDHKFIVKLVNDLLPTGKRVSRYKPYYDHRCPSCYADQEDRHHLFQCPHTSRDQWRSQFLLALRTKMKDLSTSPMLSRLLLDGIQSYFDDTQFQIEDDHPYADIYSDQEKLGWHQVFLGRFARGWGIAQQKYLHLSNRPLRQNNHSTGWTTALTQFIWQEVKQLWTIRNQDRHGRDKETKEARLLDQAREETRWLYEVRPMCKPNIQRIIFHSTIDEHFRVENTLPKLRAWIQLHRATILTLCCPEKRQRTSVSSRTRRTNSSNPTSRRRPTTSEDNTNPPETPTARATTLSPTPRARAAAVRRQLRNSLMRWLRRGNSEGDNRPVAELEPELPTPQGLPAVKLKHSRGPHNGDEESIG